jgi:hypothetical protein
MTAARNMCSVPVNFAEYRLTTADGKPRLGVSVLLAIIARCYSATSSVTGAPTGGAAVRKRPPAATLSCSCERGYAPGETVSDPQVFDAEQLYEELSKIWNR